MLSADFPETIINPLTGNTLHKIEVIRVWVDASIYTKTRPLVLYGIHQQDECLLVPCSDE